MSVYLILKLFFENFISKSVKPLGKLGQVKFHFLEPSITFYIHQVVTYSFLFLILEQPVLFTLGQNDSFFFLNKRHPAYLSSWKHSPDFTEPGSLWISILFFLCSYKEGNFFFLYCSHEASSILRDRQTSVMPFSSFSTCLPFLPTSI